MAKTKNKNFFTLSLDSQMILMGIYTVKKGGEKNTI